MMRRAEVVEFNKPLVIRELPIPEPPPKGLVIKTSYAGVCHSDIHMWENEFKMGDGKAIRMTDFFPDILPMVLGHEIAGVIHSIGGEEDEGSDPSLKVGDRVVLYPWLGCGACGLCKGPSPQKCPMGVHTLGGNTPGGYSSHVAITTRKHVLKVPDSVALDVASMFPCSALTTYHAVITAKQFIDEIVESNGKSTLLIIGAGGLGLWSLQMAKAMLPKNVKILSADITEDKLKTARQRGADGTVLWNIGISEPDAIKAAIGAAGAPSIDAVIDFVGSSETMGRALTVVSKAGLVVPVGLFGGKIDFGIPAIILKNLTISAKYVGSVPQLAAVMKLAAEGKIESPPLQHVDLSEINDVLNKLRDGKIKGRAVIKF